MSCDLYDLSNVSPGTELYMKIYVTRYIAFGGEFPQEYILEYLKNRIYPQMFGKRCFPGFGLTLYNQEQQLRRDELKRVLNFD